MRDGPEATATAAQQDDTASLQSAMGEQSALLTQGSGSTLTENGSYTAVASMSVGPVGGTLGPLAGLVTSDAPDPTAAPPSGLSLTAALAAVRMRAAAITEKVTRANTLLFEASLAFNSANPEEGKVSPYFSRADVLTQLDELDFEVSRLLFKLESAFV